MTRTRRDSLKSNLSAKGIVAVAKGSKNRLPLGFDDFLGIHRARTKSSFNKSSYRRQSCLFTCHSLFHLQPLIFLQGSLQKRATACKSTKLLPNATYLVSCLQDALRPRFLISSRNAREFSVFFQESCQEDCIFAGVLVLQ